MRRSNIQWLISLGLGLLLVVLPNLVAAASQVGAPAHLELTGAVPLQQAESVPAGPQQQPPLNLPQGQATGFLTGPNAGDPLDIALAYIHQNQQQLGLTDADLADIVVKDRYVSRHNGVTHLYLRQRLEGIELFNGDININIDREGRVINLGNRFISDLSRSATTRTPALSAMEAVQRAAGHLRLAVTEPLVLRQNLGGPARAVVLSDGGVSLDDIPAKLVYQPYQREVRLAWDLVIRLKTHEDWLDMRIDAVTGELLSQNNWIVNDNYHVFALPKESPASGPRTLEINPADTAVSPFGWHDTNGVAGAEFTDTRGNNVFAQEDADSDDTGGARPDGGPGLVFSYTLDLTLEPSDYLSASITNLFYWNNVLHDIHYHYGFDEASGNFQENNYGGGGSGGDPVQADAQDGSGTDNANFGTPPDGFAPRMQMYRWTFTLPERDSDLDNGVIIHEYGHGVSTRLTGGPSNVSCLFGAQSGGMGEGWSDWWALALTAGAADTGPQARGIGAYVLGQPPNGDGIRNFPYSTNMGVNPQTYSDLPSAGGSEHNIGEIWAVTLWDMYWNLVADYGFDPDLYNGSGGNNLAMQLVMDGLKLQPCNPTFLEARDAILLADMVNNGGVNQCRIWEAFTKRGMGENADDGGNHNSVAVTANFDPPLQCLNELVFTKSAAPAPAQIGQVLTYTLFAANYTSATLTGVRITDTVPVSTTYVPGSASHNGAVNGGTLQWNIGALAPDAAVTRTFQVVVGRNFNPRLVDLFFDDMESGGGKWKTTGLWHLETDSAPCGNSFSPKTSWYYGRSPACNYDTGAKNRGRLTTAKPIVLPASAAPVFLTFRSWEDTEDSSAYDTRRVLISTNGKDFTPLLQLFNDDATWHEEKIQLSSYAGQKIWLRFEFDTIDEVQNSFSGWYIDDVRVAGRLGIGNTAYVSSNQGIGGSATTGTSLIHVANLQYAPVTMVESISLKQLVTRTLIISNTGTIPLHFTISEVPGKASFSLTLPDKPTGVDPSFTPPSTWAERPPVEAAQRHEANLKAVASLAAIIDDPANDADFIDVTTVKAGSDASAVTLRLTFNSGLGPRGVYGFIPLDTDQNAATGLPPTALSGLPTQDIGYDYYISLFSLPTLVDIFDASNQYVGSVNPVYLGHDLELTIPLSVLGNDDGFMDVTMVLGNFFGPTDWAPDAGHGIIFDAPWLSESPLQGRVAPNSSQVLQVVFNSHAVTRSGIYSAQLHFRGNMANPVVALPVEMRISPPSRVYLPVISKNR